MHSYYFVKFPGHIRPAIADVSMFRDDTKRGYISRINVPQPQRGQGHASTLLKRIIQDADQQGITLYLEPVPGDGPRGLSHTALIRWYEKYGFIMEDNNQMRREPCLVPSS